MLVAAASAQGQGQPQAAAGFPGYTDAPAFEVVERPWPPAHMPCMVCHQVLPANSTPRPLPPPHPELNHGAGRMWCLNCHNAEQRDQLQNLLGQQVEVQDAHLICGQCHFDRQKDWYFGAHGKRVENWRGERRIYACTHCHDPHAPAIKPRAPQDPPPVRVGLTRDAGDPHERIPLWQQGDRTATPEARHD